tara:strand:+ start:22669 stop:24246 length:1578 start_codon:yes stop_codon:yes gene_type:complete
MPVVFSPGEPETRPLDPTATVYTTAQKVADLLDIGPKEAVLMSAAADTDAVYVTGNEYRSHGFSVGDKIRVYSDADPLGEEDLTITAIGKGTGGKAGHVKITFSGATLTAADYEVADNGYVQNQASFTNGRISGLTKDKVDHVIQRMQDRIDNITHNAWRPYLVTAEYINFDTYKPYRRRYYTDYVGTAPLLFRNVQQMLRIELWQGDDYREICGAEARIKFNDVSNLASSSIFISPGNGTVATLAQGTASNQWRDDFDPTTVAQNLADLINKEDRVSKATVEFSPAFTLEGSTSNVALHNEFLATANADLGTGVVKVTSMRPVKSGESCSIVTNSSDITIEQTQTNSATVSSASSGTITVNSTTGFVDAGVAINGAIVFRYTGKTSTSFTGCVDVVGDHTAVSGTITQQSLVVDLQGGSSSGDVGRLRDWWLDPEQGIVYFNNSYPFFEWNAIKVAYVYGERYVEKAIEDVCTKMVAIELLMADDRSVLIPEGTQNIDLASKVQLYQAEIDRTLPRYVELVVFE